MGWAGGELKPRNRNKHPSSWGGGEGGGSKGQQVIHLCFSWNFPAPAFTILLWAWKGQVRGSLPSDHHLVQPRERREDSRARGHRKRAPDCGRPPTWTTAPAGALPNGVPLLSPSRVSVLLCLLLHLSPPLCPSVSDGTLLPAPSPGTPVPQTHLCPFAAQQLHLL